MFISNNRPSFHLWLKQNLVKYQEVSKYDENDCNISRRKGNQTMKFGQLIEYSMRNIFVEKSYTTYGGETISRPFSKKSKLSISLDQ